MHFNPKIFGNTYCTPENFEWFMYTIHNCTEQALMRMYARKKIHATRLPTARENICDFQLEIERALDVVTISDIEKIWRMGSHAIDDIIAGLLRHPRNPTGKTQITGNVNNFYPITTPTEFCSLFIAALLENIGVATTTDKREKKNNNAFFFDMAVLHEEFMYAKQYKQVP